MLSGTLVRPTMTAASEADDPAEDVDGGPDGCSGKHADAEASRCDGCAR
jgi:hypothetical protein